MAAPVRTRRKNAFNLLREAQKLASFDEFPMLRPEVDPQLLASRNEVSQPFYLILEKDSVLAQIGGQAKVAFSEGSVRHFDMGPGDFVYVPGGSAHRIFTEEPGVQVRYKARLPGNETVLWLCDKCGTELGRHSWNATTILAQTGYQTATEAFNANAAGRKCPSCGTEHSAVDLSPFRWAAVAEALSKTEDED